MYSPFLSELISKSLIFKLPVCLDADVIITALNPLFSIYLTNGLGAPLAADLTIIVPAGVLTTITGLVILTSDGNPKVLSIAFISLGSIYIVPSTSLSKYSVSPLLFLYALEFILTIFLSVKIANGNSPRVPFSKGIDLS